MPLNDPDSPVTNDPLPSAEATPPTQPSSEGPEARTRPANDDGSENVEGYQRTNVEAMAMATEISFPESLEGLRDIGEASFGELPTPAETTADRMVAEAIIGNDDRTQINDTTVFPYRAIASLLIIAADGSPWIGTGWFISPRTLITAGHCVFINGNPIKARNGWVRSIKVIPGRNGASSPFGSAVSNNFKSVSAWTTGANPNHDYGAIILNQPLGNSVGTFGYGVYSDAKLLSLTANISGYPGDKPSGTQWFHARKVTAVNPTKVFYDIDTMGGQSGAPVWHVENNQRLAIAVHAYGGATANSGTRITAAVHANLTAWKQ